MDGNQMKLSQNFTLAEMTKSATAIRMGIDNNPRDEHLENITALCVNVLQKVRDEHGSVRVSSGYRSPALNEAIGGSTTSQHSKGQAADFECSSISNYDLAVWIDENLEYDQLILEFYTAGEPSSGWVHVSYKESGNRKQALTAVKENGKTVYKVGLVQ